MRVNHLAPNAMDGDHGTTVSYWMTMCDRVLSTVGQHYVTHLQLPLIIGNQ